MFASCPNQSNTSPAVGVRCMTIDPSNGDVYFAGDFTTVNGLSRLGLACITRNGILKSWNPGVASGGVTQMKFTSAGIYVIGTFTNIGGGSGTTNRNYMALLDTTGSVLSWDPNHSFAIWSSAPLCFDTAGAGPIYLCWANFLAQVSSAGVVSAAPWGNTVITTSGGSISINTCAVQGSYLYIGGQFTSGNTNGSGGTQALGGIARIITSTSYVDSWAPVCKLSGNAFAAVINSLCFDSGGTLYVAGHFDNVIGTTQTNWAAINTSGPSLTSWLPTPTGSPVGWFVVANGTDIYWAGQYTSSPAKANQVGCMTAAGSGAGWDPYTGGPFLAAAIKSQVMCIAPDASNPTVPAIWIGGTFSTVLNGTITRLEITKFADRTQIPTALAY